MRIFLLSTIFFIKTSAWYYGRAEPNAWTTGGVWPLPWQITYFPGNHTVNPSVFRLQAKTPGCDIIDKAIQRYRTLAFPGFNAATYQGDQGTLTSIIINVASSCPTGVPTFDMDESYSLSVTGANSIGIIQANQVWGALRAIETFSHLVFLPNDNVVCDLSIVIDI